MNDDRRALRAQVSGVTIGAIGSAAVLLALLGVQHVRHGWPFSLHHVSVPALPATEPGEPSGGSIAMPAGLHGRVAVELAPAAIATAGLALEPARMETISRSFRAVAVVVPDERSISRVHTRVSGWIEELMVASTGTPVRPGQPLATIFSQDLYASQTEYLAALRRMEEGFHSAVVQGARARLGVLGMAEEEIGEIERTGEAKRLVTVTSPYAGVVLRRGVSVGTAVDPSTELFTLADLSVVWVIAELPEAESASIDAGTTATLDFSDSGIEPFESRVDFVYPTLSERTRTLRARFVVPNPGGQLRPGIYGSATLSAPARDMLTITRDAVVDTGSQQHVFIAADQGMFEPRQVRLGSRLGDRVEVLAGLAAGELVVSSGVFLLDSESRLRGVGGAGIGHAGHGAGTAPDPGSAAEVAPHAGH